MDIYEAYKEQFFSGLKSMERGDPNATPEALFKVVDAENSPLRFNLGSNNLAWTQQAYAERIATWEAWQEVSASAQGDVK